jgi:hypothetical protein
MGIFPRNDNMALMPVIDRINGNLSRFADGRKVRYLNINDKLAGGDGRLFDGMMNAKDRLHPTVQAYQVWADALKPVLTELLGPPGLPWITPRRPPAIPAQPTLSARKSSLPVRSQPGRTWIRSVPY